MQRKDEKPESLNRADIKNITQRIDELPAPPSVATRVLSMAVEKDSDFKKISRLIESDQSLTLKVLKLSNSMAYGYHGRVTSVEQATAILGFSTLKNVVLGIVIREALFQDPEQGDPYLQEIWKHSLACAVAAQLLAERRHPKLTGEAFAAGMIHDCGKLVMLTVLPEAYEKVLEQSRTEGVAVLDLENEVLGIEHTVVGKWLAQKWDLPRQLIDAAWLHHQPPEVLSGLERNTLTLLVALADNLAHEVMVDYAGQDSLKNRNALVKAFGITEEEVEEIKSLIGKRYADRAAIFDLENDAALFYFEALQRANKKLVGLNLDLEQNNDRLGRSNRIFSAISEAGLQLACAQDAAEVLDIAATILIRRLDVREGFIYRIDGANRAIEARRWRDPDNVSDVRCRLSNDMTPIFEDKKGGVPQDIRPLLADYLSRAPSMPPARGDVSHFTFMDPFFVSPMIADGAFLGEILFRLEFKYGDRLLPQEYAGYSQLANLTAASLNRLDLHLQLEERAEGLGGALRKIRQINRKLLQAERLAAVGQLAAGAAHEINNPLAIIYARAQLLELKEEDAKKKKNFRQMIEQIERITSILNNLMDFARPAAPKFEPVSLNDILEKTLALIQGGLKKLNIRVKKHLEPDLPPVMGDAHQLEQVFLNLFINAEHAMEEAGGVLAVSTRMNAKQNRELVTVADNGVGIPKKHLGKIFDPFFTTKEEGKGTGLGMSTSYGIVTSHQGDIRVTSEKGVGTKVTVELPVDQNSITQARAASKRAVKKAAPKENAVLVVDDEKYIREILKETLTANGYTVETAVNGQEGLSLLSQGKYRLLLLDLRMPWVNGLSLLSRIRHLVEEMPVIVLTGLAGPEEVEEAMSMGASKCVRKPFQIEELLRDISEILKEKDVS